MATRKPYLFMFAWIIFAFASCDVDIPIREMTTAKTAIEKARSAMAEKYDPETFKSAGDQLNSSHSFIMNKKSTDAKNAAIESARLAELAFRVSLPKALDEKLADANAAYKEADMLNAAQFAPEKFEQAGKAIGDAEQLKTDQKLWDAFEKAKEGLSLANEAREAGIAKLPQLKEELAAMQARIEEFLAQKLTDQQMNDIKSAKGNLDKAGVLLSQNNAKEAVPLMSESAQSLEKVKLAAKKTTVKERLALVRKETEQLKKERGSETAGEDIETIVAYCNEADSLLEKDQIDEADAKITDAENALSAARDKTLKGLAESKAKAVEKMIEEAKKKDAQKKLQTEIGKAEEMAADGKRLLDEGSYRDSIAKYNEAEALLNSLGIAREKESLGEKGADKGEMETVEGKRYYKVIYNKKKRDCLWRIAAKVYNNARLWPVIYMANKEQIKDPDLIFPGQKFIIPEVGEEKEKLPEKKKEPDEAVTPGNKTEETKEDPTE